MAWGSVKGRKLCEADLPLTGSQTACKLWLCPFGGKGVKLSKLSKKKKNAKKQKNNLELGLPKTR